MKLESYRIELNSTLRQAMEKIDANRKGLVFISDQDSKIVGMLTDGDIRRALLNGSDLEDNVLTAANRKFVCADQYTPREEILKQLDQKIKVIPVLDNGRHLVDVISSAEIPVQTEKNVFVRSRAPVRISFSGGGSDLTHYFASEPGAVLNATITLYSNAILDPSADSKVVRIFSQDLNDSFEAPDLASFLERPGQFGLFQSLLRAIKPDFGFDLYVDSDFPNGSGLGGSSAVSAAVLGCFNELRRDKWTRHDMSEIAFQAERLHMGVPGGWQDQYATVFGGFNFMEFRADKNLVHPLRLPSEIQSELEQRLVLCDTGISHNSGEIHSDQKIAMQAEDVQKQVKSNVALCYQMREQLLRGRLADFGKAMHDAWLLKRNFGSKITSSGIDSIYDYALQNGAMGGKLLGAGGGGFFLFFVGAFQRAELVSALRDRGLNPRSFQFCTNGVQSWTVRSDT